jgi:hypothetical protein
MADKESIQQVIKIVESIIEGCVNVQEEKGINEDAKNLARYVKKDCKLILEVLKERQT